MTSALSGPRAGARPGAASRAVVVLAAALAACAGCGPAGDAYGPYAEARRAPSTHELGPHGGHLIELDNGATYAELAFDEAARTATLYVLGNDFLSPLAIEPEAIELELVERRPWRIRMAGSPLPHDPAGRASRFEAAAAAVPGFVRTIEDLEGTVALIVDGKTLAGSLGHDHGGRAESAPRRVRGSDVGLSRLLPLLAVYCTLIVIASLGGGWLPLLVALTHTRMQILISLVGGLMLGIGLFHMLPHAVAQTGSIDSGVRWAMAGLLGMFFLIRAFHFHQHSAAEVPPPAPPPAGAAGRTSPPHDHDLSHEHDCGHDHDHDHDHDHAAAAPAHRHGHSHHPHAPGPDLAHPLSWLGVAIGLGLHTAIDGMALAASMQADASHGATGALYGFGTFLAIVLHKPLDAVSIASLMQAAGWSAAARHAVNAGFALMCPLGAALFLLGLEEFSAQQAWIVGSALAFSAGVFLCISLGDLLPELEFHTHDRFKLSAALLAGVALAWAIGFLEPAHTHAGSRGDSASHAH